MPTCNYCHKNGLFLRLEKNGCCDKCVKTIREAIHYIEHEIEINSIYLSSPASAEDLDRALYDLEHNYEELIKYKSLCFTGKNPNPEISYQLLQENHDKYYVHLAKQEIKQLIDKLGEMKIKKYQLARISSFLESLENDYSEMNDQSLLDPIRKKIEKLREKYSE